MRWVRYLAPAVVLIAVAQAAVEGPRWQMVPAYVLTGLFFLVWLWQKIAPAGGTAGQGLTHRLAIGLAIGLGALGLVVSIALPIVFPVIRFPRPSGPYAIGTMTYHWVDVSRPEIFTADPNDHRELMVQVWYPAEGNPSARRAPYVQDARVLWSVADLLHLPRFIFGHVKYVTTNGVPSAPVADGGPYPVLIFSHGRSGFRGHNTFQVEELVSHGYIVATIDHPYASSGVVFPDGRLVAFDPRMFDPAHPGHPKFYDVAIPFLAQDVSFALDQLADLNQADPNGILTGQLDLQRTGMFGVSLGGAITAEASKLDPRIRASLMMDVFMPADVVQSGLKQPAMWISRDAKYMKLEHWTQEDIDETVTTPRAVFESKPRDAYLVLVAGMFHANFSDLPFFTPLSSRLGMTGPIDANRGHDIVNAYSLAFFDRYLKGQPAPLLDGPPAQFPEVTFDKRGP